jgi:hypothetical protein
MPWQFRPVDARRRGLRTTLTIEMAFAKLKTLLRKAKARTSDDFCRTLGDICDLFEPDECWNYLKAAGYVADSSPEALGGQDIRSSTGRIPACCRCSPNSKAGTDAKKTSPSVSVR